MELIGRTKVGYTLTRLDMLTRNEALMAITQNLSATPIADESARGVTNTAIDIRVDDRVADIDDRAVVIDDVNQVKRLSSLNLISTKEPYTLFQKINCRRNFTNGFPRRIRQRIIILRVAFVTRKSQIGLFKVTSFKSGSQQAHFFGSTENVCPAFFPT